MGTRHPGRWLFGLFVIISVTPGCRVAHPQPVSVLVQDAETKAPVANAGVQLWCPDPRGPNLGKDAIGNTGGDGVARVRSAAGPDLALVLAVEAAGYLPEEIDFRPNAAEPGGPVVIEVFRGPRPVVELVVPNGYRGLVKAEVRVQEDAAPGRAFTFAAAPPETVKVVGPAVFKQGAGPEFRAKYADGAPLPMNPEGVQIGFMWLTTEGDTRVFVVGTKTDWAAARREIEKSDPPRSGSRSQGGQGRGGGHHGGRGGGGGRIGP